MYSVNALVNKNIDYKTQKVEFRPIDEIKESCEGDCTCIAHLKMTLLLEKGIDCYLQRCWEKGTNLPHMVCIVPGERKEWCFGKSKPCEFVLDVRKRDRDTIFTKKELKNTYFFVDSESNKYRAGDSRLN